MTNISIVTAVRNCGENLGEAILSVDSQFCESREYVVIDGDSHDGTELVLASNLDHIDILVSEPDEGIYDALNKGIARSSGDVIGFLHADDVLADDTVLHEIREAFLDSDVEAVFGDLVYVDQQATSRIHRYWQEASYDVGRFHLGWMPPHPTVYIRKEVYEEFGGYRTDFSISADYEMMVRLMVKHRIRVKHIPKIMVKMRKGGKSNASWANRRLANWEDRQAWIVNGLKPPPFLRLTKPLRKLPQYWRRPPVSLGPD
ncbi:MAG: glycosyltransferase family 2 protein [Planctomycetota bacterium]